MSEDFITNVSLEEISDNIKAIKPEEFKNMKNTDIIDLYFISKKRKSNREYKYNSYSPSISKEIQKKIKCITLEKIEQIKDTEQVIYNPSGQVDNVVEICELASVKNFDDFTSSIEDDNQLEKMININDIHTYCFEFRHKNERIIVLRRFTKMKKLRKGLLGILKGGTFEDINRDLLGIDNDIDLILYNDNIIVLNHISLERIFNLEEQFKNEAKETIRMIESKNVISNFEEFEEDVLSNIPAIKRLTKIGSNETLPLFFDNFNKVVEVSNMFGLGITFNDKEDKIIYKDKSQITEITLLMNDSYYRTLIGRQKGKDVLK